jgi:signal transduction histidine kinase
LEIPENLDAVIVDPRRLREVLDNLLDNALKYTPSESSIWIECSQTTKDLKPVARITVRDDGPGIPDGQLERIFEPFHQSSEPATYKAGGVGLGLAICRHIMDAHKGSLTAEPVSAGHGITFFITLPVSVANGEEEPIDNPKELSTST